MIEPIQVIIIVFALFAFSRAVLRSREGKISRREFSFWSMMWITLIVLSLLPGIVSFFANLSGIKRGVDIVVYLSIIAWFYMNFILYVKLEEQDKDLPRLVRKLAKK